MSSMEEIIIAYANRFTDLEQLKSWAEELGILECTAIQERINDLHILEEDSMGSQVVEKTIYSCLREIDDIGKVKEWAETNDLQNHEMVEKRIAELSEYHCDYCTRIFTRKSSLIRHVQCVHDKKTFQCHVCKKSFSSNFNRVRHQKVCCGPTLTLRSYTCKVCKANLPTLQQLKHHAVFHTEENGQSSRTRLSRETTTTEPKPGPSNDVMNSTYIPTPGPLSDSESSDESTPVMVKSYTCRTCKDTFENRKALYIHHMKHKQEGSGLKLQPQPFSEEQAPWQKSDGIDETLRQAYEVNAPLILEENTSGNVTTTFNIPLSPDFNVESLLQSVERIYDEEEQAFRINFSFGVLLQNIESGEYRYFRPYTNETLFDQPLLINKRRDVNQKLRLRLETMDLVAHMLRQRENSKWRPVFISNVHIYIFRTNFPLGAGQTILPKYIEGNKNIIALTKHKNGTLYHDNLCMFRCLATHHKQQKMETSTRQYYQQWIAHLRDMDMGDFTSVHPCNYTGVNMSEVYEFERCFNIGIHIFKMFDDGKVVPVYRSSGRFSETMNLNLYENHLSYISNIRAYSRKFQCETCEQLFTTSFQCLRHQRNCAKTTKSELPGGYYKLNDTLFDNLEECEIVVPLEKRVFPWFIVYDFEAMLSSYTANYDTEKLSWTKEHKPISVSVSTNVKDFEEPRCFVDADMDQLINDMIAYMTQISSKAKLLAQDHWSDVITALQEKIDLCEEKDFILKNMYANLMKKTLEYCSQIPVLGFNSSKYDLNLVKRVISKHLGLHDKDQKPFTVKQCNTYSCISTSTFKFLDISNYLAPGTSYSQFLSAYGIVEQKGYFPYEWFDCVEKLDFVALPLYEHFYSSLKRKNITPEQYDYCKRIWNEKKMKTFKDFLIWYNNLDVGPFVLAVTELQKFYFNKGIDIFKNTMSVPGIARQMLFNAGAATGATFSLFNKSDQDLYNTVRNNIVGGPSIIFNRHSKVRETFIRNNHNKPCEKIVGYDANALYLWAIGQQMPIGPYIRRRKENDFRPDVREKYMSSFYWMDWISKEHHIKILHKLNNRNEKRIGPFPVDGYCAEQNIVFQFHGCYFHGHFNCPLTKNIKNEKWLAQRAGKQRKTEETTAYLRERGYTVIEMWECDFCEMKRQNAGLQQFINAQQPEFYKKHKTHVNEDEILESVRKEEFFGMIEVDIEIPEEWGEEFKYKNISPREYFSEMAPLFCTTEVPFEVIGSHMQDYVRRYGLSEKPRKLLVGGLKAEKMLLSSPLLKWYLDHGLCVTKIYQTVEYKAGVPFSSFVQDVSNARRMGDRDPQFSIIADTSKLIGNSSYGSLIMDKSKHRTISYIQGDNDVSVAVNNKRFRNLTCLDEKNEYYEVEFAKTKIRYDLPIQLGFFILQYAKIRMLQFYYDFMDRYVERTDFEYCEMDTDSAYMALSGPDLISVVKPEMKQQLLRELNELCKDVIGPDSTLCFPRTCCTKHAKYDKRTPGLFKLEFEGDEIVGLCSKTYIVNKTQIKHTPASVIAAYSILRKSKKLPPKRLQCKRKKVREQKYSCKGISKAALQSPLTIYKNVLKTQLSKSAVNNGFRVRNNTMFSYKQERCGFSYFYCKRRVLDDGIHTSPLDLTLRPIDKTGVQQCEQNRLTDEDRLIAQYMVECMEDDD